jgi:serine/threonine protein kinase
VVYEVGEVDGTSFIAMQLVRGEPLRNLLHSRSLPAVRAVELALEIAEGLSTAHDKASSTAT